MEIAAVIGGGGTRLHVREWGRRDAPPILFVHGWSQHHLAFRRQFESALADEFRLVAFDLRGHGMSAAPGDIVIGDNDGVVIIPLAQAELVLGKLKDVKAAEAALEAKVKAGLEVPDFVQAILDSDRVIQD